MNTMQRNPQGELNELFDSIGLKIVDGSDPVVNATYGTTNIVQNRSLPLMFERADGREFRYTLWLRPDAISPRLLKDVYTLFTQVLRDAFLKTPAQWKLDSNGMRSVLAYGMLVENVLPVNSFLYLLGQFMGDELSTAFYFIDDLASGDLSRNFVGEQYMASLERRR